MFSKFLFFQSLYVCMMYCWDIHLPENTTLLNPNIKPVLTKWVLHGNLPRSRRLETDCSWLLSTKCVIHWVHTLGLTRTVSKKLEDRSHNTELVHLGLSESHSVTIDLVFALVLADIAACILGSKASLELLTWHQMSYIKSRCLL